MNDKVIRKIAKAVAYDADDCMACDGWSKPFPMNNSVQRRKESSDIFLKAAGIFEMITGEVNYLEAESVFISEYAVHCELNKK